MSYRVYPQEDIFASIPVCLSESLANEESPQTPKVLAIPTFLSHNDIGEAKAVLKEKPVVEQQDRRISAVTTLVSLSDEPRDTSQCTESESYDSVEEPQEEEPAKPLFHSSDMPELLPSEAELRAMKERCEAERVTECLAAAPTFQCDEGWTQLPEKQGVKLFRKEDGLPMIKGRMNFGKDISCWDVIDFVRDWEAKKKWDDQYANGSCLVEFDYFTAVVWLMFKGMMLYEARDFIQVCYTHEIAPGKVVQVVKSTPHYPEPKLPRKKAVRGDLIIGGFFFETLSDGSLEVTFVAQVDLKVKASSSVIARMPFFTDQPLCLVKILATLKSMRAKGTFKPRANRPVA